jgi:hypothetical protein
MLATIWPQRQLMENICTTLVQLVPTENAAKIRADLRFFMEQNALRDLLILRRAPVLQPEEEFESWI